MQTQAIIHHPSPNEKRQNGQYFTQGNPFSLSPFKTWAKKINLKNEIVLEPFAGANNIIRSLQDNGFAKQFASFDIQPADSLVDVRDTIKDFPTDFRVSITNPPWLAKNSANRRGLPYPETQYDDLYKHCLDLCLLNCSYVGALIPATFLQSELFRERLDTFILLHDRDMFTDTDNPVALVLFSKRPKKKKIYYDNKYIGNLEELKGHLPAAINSSRKDHDINLKFNDPDGKIGFIAFDNTREPTIKFCRGEELDKYDISHTTRMITKINGPFRNNRLDSYISELNDKVKEFRKSTMDVFLTPFKGIRTDGMYRRRMDYSLARAFMLEVLNHA